MSSSDIFIGETIGTAVLILLGGGVCAAVTLKASKARNAGWLAITFGWGFAVLTAVYTSAPLSGAHLNPAVTLALAIKDDYMEAVAYKNLLLRLQANLEKDPARQKILLAEADKLRTALLRAVGHDLRSPLASAKASVTSLRSDDVEWSESERAELLETADESLDLCRVGHAAVTPPRA